MTIKINLKKIFVIVLIIIVIYYLLSNNEYFDNSSEEIIKNNINNVCIVSFCKDEYDLIDDFINYYSYLFGVHNIYIIDNNSTHPHVLNVYEKFKEKGGNLLYCDDYSKQGEETTKVFNSVKHKYDYLIGIDIDEFICLKTSDDLSDINELKKYFDNLPKNIEKFEVSFYNSLVDPNNINYVDNKFTFPAKYINYFKLKNGDNQKKYFYKSNTFITTKMGSHDGSSINNTELYTDIIYYHYYNTGSKRLFERAYNNCIGLNYFNNDDDIINKILKLQNKYLNKLINDIHRIEITLLYLLKEYLIIKFIKYLNKLPTIEELNFFNNNLLINLDDIDKLFITIPIKNENININYNNLLYYDEQINKEDNNYFFDDKITKCLEKIKKYNII